jgi:hypothetical protein
VKKIYVREALRRGLVIYSHFPDIDHPKYYIFMGLTEEPGIVYGFFINSTPPSLARKNPKILDFQIEITPESYDFLSHTSFINCWKYFIMDFHEMISGLIESPSKIRGHLAETHLQKALDLVKKNPTFSKLEKQTLTENLVIPPF